MWILMIWCINAYDCEVPNFQEFSSRENCVFALETYSKRSGKYNKDVLMVCMPK